jgi:threonine aldolase
VSGSSSAIVLNFRSDNIATVSPEILRAIEAVNHGPAASYGDD